MAVDNNQKTASKERQNTSLAPTSDELPSKPPNKMSASNKEKISQESARQNKKVVLKERFVLEQMLARGGMGMVYKALDLRKEEYQDRNPHVAIKILNEECKSHPDFFMALQREAKKAQSLAHPNIATVYDFDADGDTVFMTMEYLTGRTLDVFIKENRPSPSHFKSLLNIVNEMGLGLAYAHKSHIVHSDFKPGNVFITQDDSVKILDFGISRIAQQPNKSDLEATVFDAGKFGALTPSYASCEMLEGNEPDPRDDIYALACITYELLTGQHPFGKEKATLARYKKMKAAPIPGLNKKCWKGLLRGLAFTRDARTPTVEQFLLDIQDKPGSSGFVWNWKWSLGLISVILLTSVIFSYTKRLLTDPVNYQNTTPSTSPSNEARNNTDETSTLLTAMQQDKITRLLEVADIHFIVGRIVDPPGSNAYDAYKQVLNIDPNDKQAEAGLLVISDHYESLARESLHNGNTKNTQKLISTGLQVTPGHSGLTALNRKIQAD